MSNETPYGLTKYLELAKNNNLPRMMSVQNPYSLVNRTYEIGMSEISIREKCGLLVYYPRSLGLCQENIEMEKCQKTRECHYLKVGKE